MTQKTYQLPTENLIIEISKKDGISITHDKVGMKNIDENTPAICDMCSAPLGAYKDMDVKHILSPEVVSRAVKNGYRPEVMIKKSVEELIALGETDPKILAGIMDECVESWVEMVDIGETPWALCDSCYAIIQKYLEAKS